MPTFNVGSTPQEIYPGWNDDSTVYNGGAHTIYLGNDSSVSTVSGYPLVPGTSLTWRKGEKLWAVIRDIQGNLDSVTIPATLVGLLNISPSAETTAKQGAARIRVGNTVVTRNVSGGALIHLGLIETAAFGAAVWNGKLDVTAVTTPTLTGLACYLVQVSYMEPDSTGTLVFQSNDEMFVWSVINTPTNTYTITVPLDSGRGAYALVTLTSAENHINGFTDQFTVTVNGSMYASFASVDNSTFTNTLYPVGYRIANAVGAVYADNAAAIGTTLWAAPLNTTPGGMVFEKRGQYITLNVFCSVAAAGQALIVCDPVGSVRYATVDCSTTGAKDPITIPYADTLMVLRGVGTPTANLTVTIHD